MQRSQRNREEILTVLLEAIDQLDVADDNSCTEDESHDACKDTANGGSSDIAAKWKPGMSIIELRAAGNVAFERKEHNRAIELYTTALHGLSGEDKLGCCCWVRVGYAGRHPAFWKILSQLILAVDRPVACRV